ncbi:ATP-binding protein [Rhizobium tubonense]|uniref:ATP-binding protein n=1 Tax=Rhizobium tubonense TaxID=484088 RepID=UPI001FCE5D40|nr:ATP-binding protein [Rhizobium tubonense]
MKLYGLGSPAKTSLSPVIAPPRLFATLALARGEGRYPKILKALAITDRLIT